MAGILKDGPIRKMLKERRVFGQTNTEPEEIANPVTISGIQLRTKAQVEGFRALYHDVMRIYDEFNAKCLASRETSAFGRGINWCTSSQILSEFVHEMMSTADKLREQGYEVT